MAESQTIASDAKPIWDIKVVGPHPTKSYWGEVRAVLAEGWEPFAANGGQIFFRKVVANA